MKTKLKIIAEWHIRQNHVPLTLLKVLNPKRHVAKLQ